MIWLFKANITTYTEIKYMSTTAQRPGNSKWKPTAVKFLYCTWDGMVGLKDSLSLKMYTGNLEAINKNKTEQ